MSTTDQQVQSTGLTTLRCSLSVSDLLTISQ